MRKVEVCRDDAPPSANEKTKRKNTGNASDQNTISPSRQKYQTKSARVWTNSIRSARVTPPLPRRLRRAIHR